MMGRRFVFLGLLVITACSSGYDACDRCGIVLISVEGLRADHLSLYGYDRSTSPALDRFAEEAVVFDTFINNGGVRHRELQSMMTSLHPRVHTTWPQASALLDAEHRTLAEILESAGYRTAAFTDGRRLPLRIGLNQGFGLYSEDCKDTECMMDGALAWLASESEKPPFLFLHSFDLYGRKGDHPYSCPGDEGVRYSLPIESDFAGCESGICGISLLREWNRRLGTGETSVEDVISPIGLEHLEALYDGCVSFVDGQIGEFLDELRRLDAYNDLLVIITSNRGDELGEHGGFLDLNVDYGYESTAWIPLLVKFPRSVFAGRRVWRLGATVDLMPTIIDAIGLAADDRAQGTSLLPAIRNNRVVRDAVLVGSSLRTDTWKYVTKREELFNLELDSYEVENLHSDKKPIVRQLRHRLLQLRREDQEWVQSRSQPNQ